MLLVVVFVAPDLLEPLLVDGDEILGARQGLDDRLTLHNRIRPLQEPLQLGVLLREHKALTNILLVHFHQGHSCQKARQSQICKCELATQKEGSIAIETGLRSLVDGTEEVVDFFELIDEGLMTLLGIGGVEGEGSLVVSGLGVCAPVVDQITSLGTLQCVRGQESVLLCSCKGN